MSKLSFVSKAPNLRQCYAPPRHVPYTVVVCCGFGAYDVYFRIPFVVVGVHLWLSRIMPLILLVVMFCVSAFFP